MNITRIVGTASGAVMAVGVLTGLNAPTSAAATPELDIFDTFVIEGADVNPQAQFALVLSDPSSGAIEVTVTTKSGTASPADYEESVTVVEIPAGAVEATYLVSITDDSIEESQESFTVKLSAPEGVVIGDGGATAVIVDNDGGDDPGKRDCGDGYKYTKDSFDEDFGYCTHKFAANKDRDDDGRNASNVGGSDCDDSNASVNPDAIDIAGNDLDDDCDGKVDGKKPRDCGDKTRYTKDEYSKDKGYCLHTVKDAADLDGDGWVAAEVEGPDCDDGDESVHPQASETDPDEDSNCDGLIGSDGGGSMSVTPVDIGPPAFCPPGAVCDSYVVECEGTAPTRAAVSRSPADGPPRGVVVLVPGGYGEMFLIGGKEGSGTLPDLQAAGMNVVQIAWPDTWVKLAEPPFGLDKAACRSASMVEYLHEEDYLPLDLPEEDLVCGFCVGGNSGGATQAAYMLSHYGMDDILDAVVMTSGPIFAALAEGCLNIDIGYDVFLTDTSRIYADYAYGFFDEGTGPCMLRDESMKETWEEDSILRGGDDYVHSHTRVVFQIGGLDVGSAPGNAAAYADALRDAGSPYVTEDFFPNAEHGMSGFLADPEAKAGFIAAFTEPQPR